MNIDKCREIIEELRPMNSRKAKKLEKILTQYEQEDDKERKIFLANRLYNYVYHLFGSLLTKECRRDLFDTNTTINEESYETEQRSNKGFYINMDGIDRRVVKDGEVVIESYVGRDYQKGFYMVNRSLATTQEEKEEYLLQSHFYFNNIGILDDISERMDHKLELITFGYELKDPRIPRSFAEKLIDFLGIRRLEEQKEKAKEKIKKGN